jgi:hypothetical protein
MTQQKTIDIKKIRSSISLLYGTELDDTSITILLVLATGLKEEFTSPNKKIDLAIEKIDAAIEKINASQKTLMVDPHNPKSQAFWFGLGQWGLGLILSVVFISLFYGVHICRQQEETQSAIQLQWYRKFYDTFQDGNKKEFDDFIKNNSKPQD